MVITTFKLGREMSKWVILFLAFIFCDEAVAQRKDLILRDSLNKKDFKKNWERAEMCCPHSIQLVSASESGIGRDAVRFEVKKSDPKVNNGYRAELRMPKEPTPDVERWYRFSTYLPEGYAVDSALEVIAQWHELPDFSLGEKYRTPPISLQIIKNEWRVSVNSASDPVNTDRTISLKKMIDVGDWKTGVWTDWVFRIHFSYKEDGILQVWRDEKMVINYTGPNYYNDKKGPFFKIGMYKAPWKLNKHNSIVNDRVIYFSDIKVGNENASYDSMVR